MNLHAGMAAQRDSKPVIDLLRVAAEVTRLHSILNSNSAILNLKLSSSSAATFKLSKFFLALSATASRLCRWNMNKQATNQLERNQILAGCALDQRSCLNAFRGQARRRSQPAASSQKWFAAGCSVRPVAGNTGFHEGNSEAQPRRYTFCRNFLLGRDGVLRRSCPPLGGGRDGRGGGAKHSVAGRAARRGDDAARCLG